MHFYSHRLTFTKVNTRIIFDTVLDGTNGTMDVALMGRMKMIYDMDTEYLMTGDERYDGHFSKQRAGYGRYDFVDPNTRNCLVWFKIKCLN
jgi:hypothetical protein